MTIGLTVKSKSRGTEPLLIMHDIFIFFIVHCQVMSGMYIHPTFNVSTVYV